MKIHIPFSMNIRLQTTLNEVSEFKSYGGVRMKVEGTVIDGILTASIDIEDTALFMENTLLKLIEDAKRSKI